MPDRNREQKVTVWELSRQTHQPGEIGSPFEVTTSNRAVNVNQRRRLQQEFLEEAGVQPVLGQHFSHSILGQKEKLARAMNSNLVWSHERDDAIPGWINLINSYASFLQGDTPGAGHQDQRTCGFMRRSAETL